MRKLFILVLFTFFIVFPINVGAVWVPASNPIMGPRVGEWDSGNLSSPFVMKENNIYKMWYEATSNNKKYIGYSTSEDGINWERFSTPVISPLNEADYTETNAEEPTVVKKDNLYYLWYCSYDAQINNPNYKIRMATSTDGINWTKHPDYVLSGTEQWEKDGVTDPAVIYHDGKFRMFYGAWGNPHSWQIGYAESEDGINWTKPSVNPLNLPSLGHLNGPYAMFNNEKYHLFYHTGGGYASTIYHVSSIDLVNWECEDGCNVIDSSINGSNSDIVGPSYLEDNNRLLLYYAFENSGSKQIGLAINELPQEESKIVIIPGLFGSWNKQAIIYNNPVGSDEWRLNPMVTDYNGIFNTLNNLGLQKDSDYYLFNYDWRKDIESITIDLNDFLAENNLNNVPIKLVGHSLGGLVARIYAQKYPSDNIKQVLTVGSPHQGVAQVYKALAGGEMDESNDLMWLAEKLAIQLYRTGFESDREILNQHFPILNNLLSTYAYLFNQNNQEIDVSQYNYKNNLLSNYTDISGIDSILTSITGEKGNTTFAYKLGNRTALDKLLNNYTEGRPIESKTQIGDYVVPGFSAKTANFETLQLDHGELVYKQQGIEKILEKLAISYQAEDIIFSEGTQIFPSLIFLVMSPVEMEVEINDQVYSEEQGMIFIKNPIDGDYLLKAKGKENGNYSILIGNLIKNKDQWYKINGTINSPNPESEIDEYNLEIKNSALLLDELTLKDQLIQDLEKITTDLNNRKLLQALKYLKNKKLSKQKLVLLKVQHLIIVSIREVPESYTLDLLRLCEKLENYYLSLNFKYNSRLISKYLSIKYKVLNGLYITKERILLLKKNRGFNIERSAYLLNIVKNKLALSKNALSNKDLNLVEINLNYIASLLTYIK